MKMKVWTSLFKSCLDHKPVHLVIQERGAFRVELEENRKQEGLQVFRHGVARTGQKHTQKWTSLECCIWKILDLFIGAK